MVDICAFFISTAEYQETQLSEYLYLNTYNE